MFSRLCAASTIMIVLALVTQATGQMKGQLENATGTLPSFQSCLPRQCPADWYSATYRVFFAPHSAELTDHSKSILEAFKKRIIDRRVYAAGIDSHMDSSETYEEDHDLDLRRAETVRRYVAGGSLAYRNILYDLLGNREPVIHTEANAAEAQNRYAEIRALTSSDDPDFLERQLLCRAWL